MANFLFKEKPFLNFNDLEAVLRKKLDHRRLKELELAIFPLVPETLHIHGYYSDWCCKDHYIHLHALST